MDSKLPSKLKIRTDSYTCREYRAEMILIGLYRQLADENISEDKKQALLHEISKLEIEMGMA